MNTRWIIVADSSKARIFQVTSVDGMLDEIETIAHPEGRQHEKDMTSDLPGRSFDSSGQGRHPMETEHSPKNQELIRFCKYLAGHLNAARKNGQMESVFIMAPPEMLGMLRDGLDNQTREIVVGDLAKNYSTLKPEELMAHLPKSFLHVR